MEETTTHTTSIKISDCIVNVLNKAHFRDILKMKLKSLN